MCLAIPGKITDIGDDAIATIDVDGITQRISLELTPKAKLGDYVLVHAGYAIEIVDEAYAIETAELIREGLGLMEEDYAATGA